LAKSTIAIEGISCAACVRRIEEGLKTLEGVREAAVNFATSRATVEYDPAVLDEGAIRNRIEEIGYVAQVPTPQDAGIKKTAVLVGGMTCAACVSEGGKLPSSSVPGVEGVSVNLRTSPRGDRLNIAAACRLASLQKGHRGRRQNEYLGIHFRGSRGDPTEAARAREIKGLRSQSRGGALS